MTAYVPRSAEFAATIDKMKARPWVEPTAAAFEQGVTPTKPASMQHCAQPIKSSRFLPRPRKRLFSADERIERRNRKRKLGGSSALPDTMRHPYTEGERAVLCVVTFEVKRNGICDRSIDEIADRAGVGRTTVQNAMHEAQRLGHLHITTRPRRGAKSLTNVVKIVSAEWRAWIARAPSAGGPIGSKNPKNECTTENIEGRKKEAFRGNAWRSASARPRQRDRDTGAFGIIGCELRYGNSTSADSAQRDHGGAFGIIAMELRYRQPPD